MRRPLGVGLGEVLWDMLPDGPQLGGAPANFAYHFNALGGQGMIVSRVGDDDAGRRACRLLAEQGLDVSRISVDPLHPTGRVDVLLSAQGTASYVFPDDVAWDFLPAARAEDTLTGGAACICFGTLCQRTPAGRAAVRSFLQAADAAVLRVFDCNLRQNFYSPEVVQDSLQLADVFKLNEEELDVLAPALGVADVLRDAAARCAALHALVTRFGLQAAALTRGAQGSVLMTGESCHEHAGEMVEVADTVGAGDAFTAALALGWLCGLPPEQIHARAASVAAYVCGAHGAMPPMPAALRLLP